MNQIVLICPAQRPAVPALSLAQPLVLAPFVGQSVLEYALTALAADGARRVTVLTSDRPDALRAVVHHGERWGLTVEIVAVEHEPTVAEAQARFASTPSDPCRVLSLDRLPQLPERDLWDSYAGWFAAQLELLPQAAKDQVGVREVTPGVFVGLRSQIEPDARLQAPCWIGTNVRVGVGAVVGPGAILGDGALVDDGAEVSGSVVGPATYVGAHTELRNSFANGANLLNLLRGSMVTLTDRFLLGGRVTVKPRPAGGGEGTAALQPPGRTALELTDVRRFWRRVWPVPANPGDALKP